MKKYKVNVNGYAYEVEIEELGESPHPSGVGISYKVAPTAKDPVSPPAKPENKSQQAATITTGEATINAPMQGKILDIKASVGESIVPGQVVAILEAMKMENEIVASDEGTVASVAVGAGQSVDAGDILITLG